MRDAPALRPLRLLVVVPSWVGDAVMATPTFRFLRDTLKGSFIGALVRPGIDQLLAGLDVFDEVHVASSGGVMGPKHAAAKVRQRRYDTALLLTNSFSSALITRLAGIRHRIGYERDARGLLLTHKLDAPKRPDGSWAPISAVRYYDTLARTFLAPDADALIRFMELASTPEQSAASADILARAGIADTTRFAILNPGGNDEAKRWPPDRFIEAGRSLAQRHDLRILVNGSPGERDIVGTIAQACAGVSLTDLGITLGSLKGVVARASVMLTNDTGPRHIAAAFAVPLVSLFGPTDHRWTILPTRANAPEELLLADPTLPEGELANDNPERCRVDRISTADVIAALDRVIAAARG
ncbi:MAG: glycosyltransferase family 9 protein [Phycisphaerales bacterium]|nr:glycosyltransferase family 9 protein [Phycisphaerales bacterium]